MDGCLGNERRDPVIVFVIEWWSVEEITTAEDEDYPKLDGRERCSLPFIIDPHILREYSALISRSQWPRGLRRRFSPTRLLRLWVRIPPRAWMFVCCECCVLSGRGLCNGLNIRPEESYRLWRVVVFDQETSKTRRLKPANGL